MNKKITLIISILIFIALVTGCGKKNLSIPQKSQPDEQGAGNVDPETAKNVLEPTPEIDLNESGLDDGGMPEINMDVDFSTEGVNLELGPGNDSLGIPEVGLEAPAVPDMGTFEFDPKGLETTLTPKTSPKAPSDPGAPAGSANGSTPPPDVKPDAATCAQFAAAPSCDLVPENLQGLCRKCR